MHKLSRLVGILALVAVIGSMLAMPVLADDPEDAYPLRDRLRTWLQLCDDGNCTDLGARYTLRWYLGIDGEGFGPREGAGSWNTTGNGVDEPETLLESAAVGDNGLVGPGPNEDCQFIDEDGDGLCDICGQPPANIGDGDGDGLQQITRQQGNPSVGADLSTQGGAGARSGSGGSRGR